MKFANTMFRTALTLVALTTILCVATTTLRNEAFAKIGAGEEALSDQELANPYAEWRVFLVGTNDYSGALPDMRFAENDVDEMRERLEELGVPRENMTVLKASNSEFYDSTSSAAIETRFEEYLDSLTEDSVAFVFFSGLGFEDNGPCYAPHDFRLDRVKRTRLSFDKIAHELAESPAKFKLLCADIARTPLKQQRKIGIDEDGRNEKVGASNLLMIMGCKAEENSYEIPNLKHGIFTSVLLDAISGMGDGNDDGETTVREFVDFLNREVPEKANRFVRREQEPDFRLCTYDLTKVLELMEFKLFPAEPDPNDLSQYVKGEEEDETAEVELADEIEEEDEAAETSGSEEDGAEEVAVDEGEESEETEALEEGVDAEEEATEEPCENAEEESEEIVGGEDGDAVEDAEEAENPYANWHVLLVGVTEYDNARSLPTVKDALSLKESLLLRGVPEGNIKTLESGDDPETAPTKENIERSLQEFVNGLTEDSTAFVYFSGYGVSFDTVSYFVPQDAEPEKFGTVKNETLIPLTFIVQELSRKTAKFKCVTFDLSYCGGVLEELGGNYSDVAVLSACKGDQLALFDSERLNISLFTLSLVRLLEEKSDVWLGDLFELTTIVEKTSSQQFNLRQTPAFYFGDYGEDYLIFPDPKR